MNRLIVFSKRPLNWLPVNCGDVFMDDGVLIKAEADEGVCADCRKYSSDMKKKNQNILTSIVIMNYDRLNN